MAKSKTTILLREIDLSKGENKRHPEFKEDGTQYLCKIHGKFYVGGFRSVWYGQMFDGWKNPSLQYDKPGTNLSGWELVYELKEVVRKVPQKE